MHFQTQALVSWKRKLGCKISMQAYQLARTQRPKITVMPSAVYQGLEWGLRFCIYSCSRVADAAGLRRLLGRKALDYTTRFTLTVRGLEEAGLNTAWQAHRHCWCRSHFCHLHALYSVSIAQSTTHMETVSLIVSLSYQARVNSLSAETHHLF